MQSVSMASRPATARLRDTACSTLSAASDGTNAVATEVTMARPKLHRAIRRRPKRSAWNIMNAVSTVPTRTKAKMAACWPEEPSPMSALANVSTWVSWP